MPFCPQCTAEYRPGITACMDCMVALVEKLDFDPPGELVQVFAGPLTQAEIVAASLENEGIVADVSESETAALGPGVNPTGLVRVMVAERDAERARRIIAGS